MKIKLGNALAIGLLSMMLHSTIYADIGAGYSGSWYNKDQSGHGFNIEYGETDDGTGYLVAYWYIYDTDGNPMFLVGVSEPDGNSVEIAFDAPYGMVYGNFDPDAVIREDAGVGTFTFVDSDNGEFDYVPSTWMVETYGVSPLNVPITKLFDVAHPNPELIEVLLERQGIQGEKGDTGPPGPTGLEGPMGPAGQDGSDHGTEIAELEAEISEQFDLIATQQGQIDLFSSADPPCSDDSGNIYVDCGNGTVTDNRTGLVWLANANCFPDRLEWRAAMDFVTGLSDLPDYYGPVEDCGLTDGSTAGDWRLPSAAEFDAMMGDALGVDGDPNCFLDYPLLTNDSGDACWNEGPSSFFDVQSEWYLTSTTHRNNLLEYWGVSFNSDDGTAAHGLKSGNTGHFWAVRGWE